MSLLNFLIELKSVAKEIWTESFHKDNVCGLIILDGKFLAVSRKNKHTEFGLPGGGREYGETEKEALKREIYEETGAVVRVEECLFSSNSTATYFCVLLTSPVLGINEENGLVKWAYKEELENGPFGKYNKELFRKVLYSC
jgi:8-oxo-dGTP pyrophosphatase MutT (NUDIX family)